MNLEISHLVVNGCSFTYCQGLENPKEQGWPALLAKKLNVPVVNLAVGGSGNDSIHRRTLEYFYQDLKNNNKPFYIVAFSGAARNEIFFKEYNKHKFDTIPLIDFTASDIDYIGTLPDIPEDISFLNDECQIDLITNLSLFACERRKLLLWSSITNTFKAHSVSYFTTDYLPTKDKSILNYVNNNLKDIADYVYFDENKLKNFDDLTNDLSKLPCNHDGYEAQEILADYVYNTLIQKYNNIVAINKDYLTLKNFYNENYKKIIENKVDAWF